MSAEKKVSLPEYQSLYTELQMGEEISYPTRTDDDKKLDITILFSHFTADIIREDVTFTR